MGYTVRGPGGGYLIKDGDAARITRDWEALVKGYGRISIEPYVPAPPPPPPVTRRTFVYVDDEIERSSNPQQHAWDLVATLARNRLAGVAIKCGTSLAREQAAGNLRAACLQLGVRFGTWDDGNLHPTAVLTLVQRWQSTFHIVQVESPQQDAVWRDGDLASLPAERGVVFTEAAWGRDPLKAARWLKLGFTALPEANLTENPQATILNMIDLALALKWPVAQISPTLYLTRGTAAARYSPEIAATAGQWSIFRYGDLDAEDWTTMGVWPRA